MAACRRQIDSINLCESQGDAGPTAPSAYYGRTVSASTRINKQVQIGVQVLALLLQLLLLPLQLLAALE